MNKLYRALDSKADSKTTQRRARKKTKQWSCAREEPDLVEMLDDPIVQVLMRKDNVSRADLLALMTSGLQPSANIS